MLRVEVSSDDADAVRASVETELAAAGSQVIAGALSDEPTKVSHLNRLRWALSRKLDRNALDNIRRGLPKGRWARHQAFRPGLRHEAARHVAALQSLEGAAVSSACRLSRGCPSREGA